MKIFAMFLFMSMAFAESDKVIYGIDNRVDVEDAINGRYLEWANSTVVQMKKAYIGPRGLNGLTTLVHAPLSQVMNVCPSEPYADQNALGDCSGFLVGPDLIATAGHCVTDESCHQFQWIFNYYSHQLEGGKVKNENIFNCKEVVARSFDVYKDEDFAIVRLDRPTNRPYFQIRRTGTMSSSARLVVIGNPSGLPTKATDDISIYKNDESNSFVMTADTYGGNSGSAVINADTGMVEGILVRGAKDFQYDIIGDCYFSNVCHGVDPELGCHGESATRSILLAPHL